MCLTILLLVFNIIATPVALTAFLAAILLTNFSRILLLISSWCIKLLRVMKAYDQMIRNTIHDQKLSGRNKKRG